MKTLICASAYFLILGIAAGWMIKSICAGRGHEEVSNMVKKKKVKKTKKTKK